MGRPKLFIGSAKASVKVARAVAARLEGDGIAEVTIWDEGVFSLNQGFLERLLNLLSEFDFAVLIWSPDDVTESKGDSKASPRDNVIFECGLFMGALGRDRVFVIHDQSVSLKVPSDFAGITLATYDGERVSGGDAESAVRTSCERIAQEITKPRFPTIVGEWSSRYRLTEDPEHPVVTETVEIKAARGGVSISSKANPAGDYYIGYGRIHDKQIVGDWRARIGSGEGKGLFLLTITPRSNIIYGYNTAPDENNGIVFTTWVLAKNDVEVDIINQRLLWAEKQLQRHTFSTYDT